MHSSSAYPLNRAPLKLARSNEGVNYYRGTYSASVPLLLQVVLYLSILQIPFNHMFLPGTKSYSIQSITEILIILTILTFHRTFISKPPISFVMFFILLALRVILGVIETPEFAWWDTSRTMFRLLLWAWFLFVLLQTPKLRRRALKFYVAACSIAVILQLLGIGDSEKFGLFDERLSAFQNNANALGLVYAIGFLVSVNFTRIFLQHFRGIPKGSIWLGLSAICFIGCLLTGSRSAAGTCALGLIIFFFPRKSIAASFRSGIVAILVGMTAFLLLSFYPVVMYRFEPSREGPMRNEARIEMIPVVIKLFLQSPIYGTGPEVYRTVIAREGFVSTGSMGLIIHNNFLLVAVEMGLMGVAIFGYGLWRLLTSAWKIRNSEGLLPLALTIPIILFAATVGNILFVWHFYFVLGYVLAAAHISPTKHIPATLFRDRSFPKALRMY